MTLGSFEADAMQDVALAVERIEAFSR